RIPCSPPVPRTASPIPTRTATCSAAAPSVTWWTSRTRPTSRPRLGPEPSSPTIAPARTLPTPRRPGASSRPPTISPPGSRHWSAAGCSTPTISASGSTACSSKIRASPDGLQYGYGITQLRWGANTVYFHGGEMPGFNSFMGYDPASKMTLVVWTNLTVSLDGKVTANALMLKVLDQIYVVSPLPPSPSPI